MIMTMTMMVMVMMMVMVTMTMSTLQEMVKTKKTHSSIFPFIVMSAAPWFILIAFLGQERVSFRSKSLS